MDKEKFKEALKLILSYCVVSIIFFGLGYIMFAVIPYYFNIWFFK